MPENKDDKQTSAGENTEICNNKDFNNSLELALTKMQSLKVEVEKSLTNVKNKWFIKLVLPSIQYKGFKVQ